jgi:hypothetical protein
MSVVLENHLLEEEEGSLVLDPLAQLHDCAPCMRCELFLAVFALHVVHHEFCDESLLDIRVVLDFFLDFELDFDSLAVRLSPNEGSIQQLHSVEPFDLLEAEREKVA